MYSVVVKSLEYTHWPVFVEWDPDVMAFDEYVMSLHPEVLSMDQQFTEHTVVRKFVFESEDHYRWFLLQVM